MKKWVGLALTGLMAGALACGHADSAGGGAPDSMQGFFHLDNTTDSYNFILHDDGRFEWGVDGCDYRQGDFGRWHSEGGSVIVEPSTESNTEGELDWPFAPPAQAITRVTLTSQADGTIRGVAGDTGGGAVVTQQWFPGGLCPVCEPGSLVPTGATACPSPQIPSNWM